MSNMRRITLFALFGGVMLGTVPVVAQQSRPEALPRISIGAVKGMAGSSVMLPVTFVADPKTPLAALVLEIEYVSNSLRFQKATLGLGAELASARIETSLSEGPPDEKGVKRARLRLTATLPDPPPSNGLPGGVLAYLLYDIAAEARPFTVKLTPIVSSATLAATPPKPVSNVTAEPGTVVIESLEAVYDRMAPALACFFFSH